MSRRSGFTDAELAAAAWRRNMKLKGSMKEEEAEVGDLEASSVTSRLRTPGLDNRNMVGAVLHTPSALELFCTRNSVQKRVCSSCLPEDAKQRTTSYQVPGSYHRYGMT